MSVTLDNPIVITSGTLNTEITNGRILVNQIYWYQPTLTSTSSLWITKKTGAGITYLESRVETSGAGISQVFTENQWWLDPYCCCVPTGVLYIYLK